MESGDEDDAFTLGEREWQKMRRDLTKQGYREGKIEGQEKGTQESFEAATSTALNHTLQLGQLAGTIEWKKSQVRETCDKGKLEALLAKVKEERDRIRKTSWEESRHDGDIQTLQMAWDERLRELSNEFSTVNNVK